MGRVDFDGVQFPIQAAIQVNPRFLFRRWNPSKSLRPALKGHPKCSDDAFKTEPYRMAIRDGKNLGILKLSMQHGADSLLHRKYFQERNPCGPDDKVSG